MSAFDIEYTYQRGFEDGVARKKELFIEGVTVLRLYFEAKLALRKLGIDCVIYEIALVKALEKQLRAGDEKWDYDDYEGASWIILWATSPQSIPFQRGKYFIDLSSAERLYDFIEEMSRLGWPEETPEEWRLNK